MVRGWFDRTKVDYNNFVKALLLGDVKAMNVYMNRVAFHFILRRGKFNCGIDRNVVEYAKYIILTICFLEYSEA